MEPHPDTAGSHGNARRAGFRRASRRVARGQGAVLLCARAGFEIFIIREPAQVQGVAALLQPARRYTR